jgi:hypothetical protein
MLPLPLPVRGGSVGSLAPFLNLASENDFVLVVGWLLGALRAGGPYPVLAIAGAQGSAKTVLSKVLRAVIDPSVAPVCSRAVQGGTRRLTYLHGGKGSMRLGEVFLVLILSPAPKSRARLAPLSELPFSKTLRGS